MTQAIATIGAVAVGEAPRPPLPGEIQPRPAATPNARANTPSLPETRAAARQQAEARGRYQVHIHAETMRIITEVVDMATGETIMYFPPGYRPNAQPVKSDDEKSPGTADR
jgi:hypothetical protein